MMKYVFLLALIGVVVYASVQDREPEFDFANATLKERTVYMQSQTDRVKSELNSGLRRQFGVLRSFSVGTVRLSRGGYMATIPFTEDPPTGNFGKKFKRELSEALCRSYVNTSSAENKISISVLLTSEGNTPEGQVTLSTAACRALQIT